MRNYLTICFVCISVFFYGQSDTTKKLTFSGYGELYYQYDFSNPANHETAGFLYSHKRHNELNANLLLLKASYLDQNYRANFALMLGNYAHYNLSAEPSWAQYINEANVGIKLSKQKNLWLDAGIMPSHIGFESAISADCWTLTRSLLAENSPYYETGLRLSYTSSDEKLYLSALVLNGWQRIRKPDFMQKPSFGMQATYKPNPKLTLNYSNFLGSDKPDSLHSFRHFHNFYLQYEPTEKIGITAGLDVGMEQSHNNNFKKWYAPVMIIRYKTSEKTALAFRSEYYADPNEILIATGTPNGFRTFGISSNFDYQINEKLKWRLEGKMYNAKDPIFADKTKKENFYISSNITFRL